MKWQVASAYPKMLQQTISEGPDFPSYEIKTPGIEVILSDGDQSVAVLIAESLLKQQPVLGVRVFAERLLAALDSVDNPVETVDKGAECQHPRNEADCTHTRALLTPYKRDDKQLVTCADCNVFGEISVYDQMRYEVYGAEKPAIRWRSRS